MFKFTPHELNVILQKVPLPSLLYLSQTCCDARYLKPEIFNLEVILQFCKETGILYVNNIDQIFLKDLTIYEKYRRYFPLGGCAHGYDYYTGTKDPDLFDMIEASKNDDVEYIKNSNYIESINFETSDMEYYDHIRGCEWDVWHTINWLPVSIWNIFWWYGGPKVKKFLKIYSDPNIRGPSCDF
jgi:hypothetical protein